MSHRLDRLELEVHTTSEPLARRLQDRLSQLHQRVLASLIGRVMDPFSPPGVLHRLETLELDLGEIPEEQLERLLPQRLEQALREALTATLPNALKEDGLDLLTAYARSGHLPWWAPRNDPRLITAALETALLLPPPVLQAWWHQALPDATARQRLLAAAQPPQALRLRQLVGDGPQDQPKNAEPLKATATALQRLASYAQTGRLPKGPTAEGHTLITTALETALLLPPPVLQAWWHQALPDATARQRLLAAAQPPQALRLRQVVAGPSEPLTPPATTPPDAPLSVDGAGLVLLTPFLGTLFDRLELLTSEQHFQSPEAAQRAMALLSWLVDGDPSPPEWRLTLAKPLCGWPLEQLWALEHPLTEPDLAEAERLLLAALAHGEGLLGETIEQLRQTWLQRPGLLSWRPGAWLLVVEHRPGDEVLDGLPWSWGWIRLPWMGELVQVVW